MATPRGWCPNLLAPTSEHRISPLLVASFTASAFPGATVGDRRWPRGGRSLAYRRHAEATTLVVERAVRRGCPVPTGASMILTTRHPWQVQCVETPRPRAWGSRAVDVVRTGLRVGMHALEELRVHAHPVGPVLCCLSHGLLLIPVPAGTIDWWAAAHSDCRPGTGNWRCSDHLDDPVGNPCQGLRFWLVPHETGHATTAPVPLHSGLSSSRALLRVAAAA